MISDSGREKRVRAAARAAGGQETSIQPVARHFSLLGCHTSFHCQCYN